MENSQTHTTDESKDKSTSKQAVELIRQKLDRLYAKEPDAREEAYEVAHELRPTSKHQEYMRLLSQSGKSIAEIQTAWHEYYQKLDDKERQEVWDEFYSQQKPQDKHNAHKQTSESGVTTVSLPTQVTESTEPSQHKPIHSHSNQTISEYKHKIARANIGKRKISARHHLQSLFFGLACGSIVILVLLFGFFNERFIAPFITPSKQISNTPIITDPNSSAISNNPEIIIPKINVEIPVVYDEPSTADSAMEKALERGVVHYATTPNPGQKGNVVIFGHSSNNIFNPGKYKFAFVLLSRLENGDTFYLDKDGKRYVYRVYKKYIVKPSQVEVLGTADKPDTATLITCDPPGTSINRLVVTGEQISPSPDSNGNSSTQSQPSKPDIIPSNSTSLWQRFLHWL